MNALCALDVLIHPQSGDESDIREAAVCAIKSLKKQIPKKPVISKANLTDFQDFHCPSCNKKIISRLDGEFIAGRLQKYCADCGQALDWSDEV